MVENHGTVLEYCIDPDLYVWITFSWYIIKLNWLLDVSLALRTYTVNVLNGGYISLFVFSPDPEQFGHSDIIVADKGSKHETQRELSLITNGFTKEKNTPLDKAGRCTWITSMAVMTIFFVDISNPKWTVL